MNTPIRVAMIGFGLSGRYLQGPFFQHHPDFDLVKIITSQSTADIPAYQNIPTFPDVSRAWAEDDSELVAICSPNDTHFSLAKKALLAGKHVLVDKPLAGSLDEVRTLYELAESKGKVLAIFQNRRFDSDFRTVQHVINSGKLGRIVRVEIRYDRFKPELNPKRWKEEIRSGNGILFDLGAHIIDQMITLFGTPTQVWGSTYQERDGTTIEDSFDIVSTYASGPSVLLHSSLLAKQSLPRYAVYGTKGSFLKYGIDPQEDHLKTDIWPNDPDFGIEPEYQKGYMSSEDFEGPIETFSGNWGLLFDSLAKAIRGESPFVVTREQIEAQFGIIENILATNPQKK